MEKRDQNSLHAKGREGKASHRRRGERGVIAGGGTARGGIDHEVTKSTKEAESMRGNGVEFSKFGFDSRDSMPFFRNTYILRRDPTPYFQHGRPSPISISRVDPDAPPTMLLQTCEGWLMWSCCGDAPVVSWDAPGR